MNKVIGALNQLFTRLYDEQANKWSPRYQGSISKEAKDVQRKLLQRWPSLEEKELEKLLKVSDELHMEFPSSKVLYLPPLQKRNVEFVPVLSMKCDINSKTEDIKLRVMLVRQNESGCLQGIGFRLESPEGEGPHGFYHAQLIKGFGKKKVVESIAWLPESQPSFPILAKCPITLFLSLYITLYGKDACWDFYNKHTMSNFIKKYMQELQDWMNWPELD